MTITWTSEKEAKQAAEQGLIPAIEHCVLHHEQNAECDYPDLVERTTSQKESVINGKFCALCLIGVDTCMDCVLDESDSITCCEEWREVRDWWNKFKKDLSRLNFDSFQAAERELVARLERELAKAVEAAKPELRHLDYGTTNVDSWVCIENDVVWASEGNAPWTNSDKSPFTKTNLGNLADDLRRNSEDLEEFELRFDNGVKPEGRICGKKINLVCWPHNSEYSPDEVLEIAQKLTQMAYTLKRKQAKCKSTKK